MATRLYFRNTTNNVGSHVRTELSTALPVGTFDDSGNAARDLETVKGTAQTSITNNSLSQTAHQDQYMGKFISDELTVSAIDANTWTMALAVQESNAQANSFIVLGSIYVLTAADAVRGFIFDSDAAQGVEFAATEDGQVYSFVGGAAVSGVVSTDRLAVELWVHATQGMAASYVNTIYFDGTTDVTDATTADAASYIETPQDIFAVPTAFLLGEPERRLRRLRLTA